MARTPSLAVAERNTKIVTEAKAMLNDLGEVDVVSLMDKFGISNQTIKRVLDLAGIVVRRKRGPNRTIGTPPISTIHDQIGRDILEYRFFRASGRKDQVANDLGISVIRLSQMEKGIYDPTLSDLIKVAKCLGVSLSQLLEERGGRSNLVDTEPLLRPVDVQSTGNGE